MVNFQAHNLWASCLETRKVVGLQPATCSVIDLQLFGLYSWVQNMMQKQLLKVFYK